MLPTITVANGLTVHSDLTGRYPFINQDGTISVPVRQLYLKITRGGSTAAAARFAVSITIVTPVLI